MKKKDLAARLTTAQDALKTATTALSGARQAVHTAKTDLTRAESDAQRPLSAEERAARERGEDVRAVAEGSNEQQRKASAQQLTAPQTDALRDAEFRLMDAENAHALAKLDWDLARQLVTVETLAD